MPRFFIDVHSDSLSDWDDDGEDLASASEAVTLARELALGKLIGTSGAPALGHAVATIRDEANTHIATVTVGSTGEPKVAWIPPAKPTGAH